MRSLSLGMGFVCISYGLHEQKAEGMARRRLFGDISEPEPPRPFACFRAAPCPSALLTRPSAPRLLDRLRRSRYDKQVNQTVLAIGQGVYLWLG